MKVKCRYCQREVEVTRYAKVAPHNDGNVRCGGSGKRVETERKEKK